MRTNSLITKRSIDNAVGTFEHTLKDQTYGYNTTKDALDSPFTHCRQNSCASARGCDRAQLIAAI